MIKLRFICIILFLKGSFNSFSQKNDFKTINFSKADRIASQLKDEKLYDLAQLSLKLTKDLPTDVEKFRAIFYWVCSNIENDFYLYLKNKINRNKYKNDSIKLTEFSKEINQITFRKLIKEKKTVCTGYAYLIKELCNLSNIECEIVNGYGRTIDIDFSKNPLPNHSWNAVKLNSKWYLCDATWSSGYFDIGEEKFIRSYIDGYFLQEPKLFLLNHYPIDEKWKLVNDELNFQVFNNLPKIYPETFNNNILIIDPLYFNLNFLKEETISFKLKILQQMNNKSFKLELVSGTTKTNIIPRIKELSESEIQIDFEIAEQGNFDVHLKLDEDYLYTWVAKIENKE